MPVIDRKLVSLDNNNEHHVKLIHRQCKNNDALQVLVSILIGSTVAVQREDAGLWIHGMIVGKGDHNHHNWLYNIQVTNTGKIITHNRQHIKPTCIIEEEYIQDQAKKRTNRQTDTLDAILHHIKNNPQSYSNKITHNNNNDSQDTHGEQGAKNNLHWSR